MARLKTDAKRLAALFESAGNPVYFLDDQRRIVYCNAACEVWLGIERQQLLGSRCDYHAGEDPAVDVTSALCPPPETFLGQPSDHSVVWLGADGQLVERQARFTPLGASVDCLGVLAVVALAEGAPQATAAVQPSDSRELHLQLQRLVRQLSTRYGLDKLVGHSMAMCRVREQVRISIESRARTSIVGPPGSGREHLGRTIHVGKSAGNSPPLLPLSCAVVDAEMLQATVLAFLERCNQLKETQDATILLLDVDQLSPAAQVELQGFLLLPTVELGTVATARRPLLELAAGGEFIGQLASLLSALVIELPPLADRREDVPLLAQQALERFNSRGERQLAGFAPEVLDRLGSMPWERNVDELTEVVTEACAVAAGPWVMEADLPERVELIRSAAAYPAPVEESVVLDEFLADVERELIGRALTQSRGNKAKAARLLGIQRARLLRRITQLGIEP